MRTRQRVVVVTSKGPQLVVVPDVRGQPEATAQDRLGQAGLTPKVVRTYDEDVAKGTVISQSTDPGQNIVKGSSVTITVSLGPAPVPVPPLAGQPAGDAQAALEADGFAVTVAKQFSDTVPAGSVIGTQPASGTKIPRGSPVTLMVSKGPQTFPMPDVRGMTKEAATARLESLGLTVLAGVVPLNNPPDTVVFQDPVPGRIVHHGDAVTIYVTAR